MSIYPDFINPNASTALPAAADEYEILSLLGYRTYQIVPSLLFRLNQFPRRPHELIRVAEILASLIELDAQIKAAIEDSAVTKTCDTEINWYAHIKMLRLQAHSLLLELARLYNVEVEYSKYAEGSSRVPYAIQYQ